MEEIYKSLLSDADTVIEQLKGHLFGMTELEGPVIALVNNEGELCANHPSRIAFLKKEDPEALSAICRQIDDGYDPCVYAVEGGCIIGTQLITESTDCVRFLLFLPGYLNETVQANMDLFELLLSQVQLICQLIEKNNRMHHRELSDLSRKSTVLCSR